MANKEKLVRTIRLSETVSPFGPGALVDILALPKVNAVGATVLGSDASGNLLYCSPGQVPQAFPLPLLPNTNWGRTTSFAPLFAGNVEMTLQELSITNAEYSPKSAAWVPGMTSVELVAPGIDCRPWNHW